MAFWIHVTPRASREKVGGLHGDALRVSVREPPVEGAANTACVRVLSEALGVRKTDISLDPAARSRRKHMRVTGDADALTRQLRALAAR